MSEMVNNILETTLINKYFIDVDDLAQAHNSPRIWRNNVLPAIEGVRFDSRIDSQYRGILTHFMQVQGW